MERILYKTLLITFYYSNEKQLKRYKKEMFSLKKEKKEINDPHVKTAFSLLLDSLNEETFIKHGKEKMRDFFKDVEYLYSSSDCIFFNEIYLNDNFYCRINEEKESIDLLVDIYNVKEEKIKNKVENF